MSNLPIELEPPDDALRAEPAISLCDTLDRILAKGISARGEITISVAGIDLLYVGLGAILASVEAARDARLTAPAGREAA